MGTGERGGGEGGDTVPPQARFFSNFEIKEKFSKKAINKMVGDGRAGPQVISLSCHIISTFTKKPSFTSCAPSHPIITGNKPFNNRHQHGSQFA